MEPYFYSTNSTDVFCPGVVQAFLKISVYILDILNKIFKINSQDGEWRKLHNEELHDLHSSPSIIRIIKSRRIRWAGHVARIGEKRNVYRLLVTASVV
jgi:hypothetical protein